VARISGTQFAVLASAISIANAAVLCQRLQETLDSQPFRHGNITIPITLSMGIASLSQDRRDNFEELLKLAQQRLCHAQSEGGDRACSSILSGTSEIEEVMVPDVEPQADSLPSLSGSLTESVSVEPTQAVDPEANTSQESEFHLDFIGMETPEIEVPSVGAVPVLDQKLEIEEVFVSDDPQTSTEFSIEEPGGQVGEYMPDETTTVLLESEQSPSDDPLSIDNALKMIASGKADLLAPHLEALLQKIRPLMDLSVEVRPNNSGQQVDARV
jgi:hypothetical protein